VELSQRGRGSVDVGLPEFGEEKAGEMMLVSDSGQASSRERSDVVGEMGGAETSEDAECEVERADDELCREAHWASGDAEVRGEPEGSGCEGRSDAGDEGFEFWLGETVEEEVGDDEIVGFRVDRKGQGAGLVGFEAGGGD
jgi:hypothetical protein